MLVRNTLARSTTINTHVRYHIPYLLTAIRAGYWFQENFGLCDLYTVRFSASGTLGRKHISVGCAEMTTYMYAGLPVPVLPSHASCVTVGWRMARKRPGPSTATLKDLLQKWCLNIWPYPRVTATKARQNTKLDTPKFGRSVHQAEPQCSHNMQRKTSIQMTKYLCNFVGRGQIWLNTCLMWDNTDSPVRMLHVVSQVREGRCHVLIWRPVCFH